MEPLNIEAAYNTPQVKFDAAMGYMELYGRSIPEYAGKFYGPLNRWIKEYINNPAPTTTFALKLDYLNSSSTKQVTDILQILEAIKDSGDPIIVEWYYEEDDEEMLDVGEDFEHAVDLPFKMIRIKEI